MATDSALRGLIEHATAHYQPIVDLETGRILGAEALVRFRDRLGATSSPGAVIDQIEQDIDAAESLVHAVLRSIAADVHPLFARHRDFYISINIPPLIVGTGRLRDVFLSSGLFDCAERFVFELTERQALCDLGRQAVTAARNLGIRVAMDDFGTGHSGIRQLIGLPIDILKIDKSQIDPLMKDLTADRLLRGIVALASALRVKVVAEGVETREQAFFLRAAGVDAGQGWFWSKAVPASELETLLQSGCASRL